MKFIHWPTFVVTILVYLTLLFLFVSLRLRSPLDCEFKKKSRRNAIIEANTGDILAVAYGSKRARLVKVFTGSMWAHSAIVIKQNNKPFALEVARYSRDNRGLLVTPLKTWLRKNKPHIVATSRYQGPAIEEGIAADFIEQHRHTKEEMFVLKWLAAMVKQQYSTQQKRKMFCSELVAHFLQNAKVMKKKYSPSGYKPWELLYGKLPLRQGHYATPELIL